MKGVKGGGSVAACTSQTPRSGFEDQKLLHSHAKDGLFGAKHHLHKLAIVDGAYDSYTAQHNTMSTDNLHAGDMQNGLSWKTNQSRWCPLRQSSS